MYAMEKDEASIVAPLFQMIPVFGLVLEYIILGIIPLPIHIVGSFIIVISGIVLAT
jgi:drug/metabolite transporter (DMT)-like permease